ncbi:hypothetical protein ABIE44_002314 [Marmoricola sp. OAE513]|uniref:hypothetical protein n=1 Tax=Marmoricola sp. OAE513 TaxID=2817894 RepID=UPI001AEA55BF
MPRAAGTTSALVGALVAALVLLSGCGGDPGGKTGGGGGGGEDGAEVTLAAKTCWTSETLGADPQDILKLSEKYAVTYFDAANALAAKPAFTETEACGDAHHVEIYKVVPVASVKPAVTSYASLLQPNQAAYRRLSESVEKACMNKVLASTAKKTKLEGVIAEPAFPDGVTLGWAPPSPQQWERGQRVYACTVTSKKAVKFSYAAVFSKRFPTSLRTCIDSRKLVYLDCARKHDRETIAILDVRLPVAAGRFPGKKGIRLGPDGRYVDVPAGVLAQLDKACTSYLRSVSTTKKLTGIAEIDPDRWPLADGTYPVACEADVPITSKSIVTTGSVYNR